MKAQKSRQIKRNHYFFVGFFTLNTRKRLFCFLIMQKMELNNKSTKNNIYVSIYLSVLNFQVRTPVPLHRGKKEDMFKIKTGASTMLSLAAIAAWAFIENISATSFWHQKRRL